MSLDLAHLKPHEVGRLDDGEFRQVLEYILNISQADRQEAAIQYFRPTSANAERVFTTEAKRICIGGGNGSGKTENAIVYLIAMATGCFPLWRREQFRKRFRGPIQTRVVLESLTTTLHPVILPKLKWWTWTGLPPLGGEKGHWGWIPKKCLIDGSWDKSWTERLRILRLLCFDPENENKVLGESTIQFNSHDQDPSDFASGDFHIVLHDEPPRYAIWKENEARTMRVAGTLMLAMTWPDDPSIPVDWIYDELYEKGMPGPGKDPNTEWIELYTTDNPHLDQKSVALQMQNWSEETRRVRIRGEPIRFSNRVHPLFTDVEVQWCYKCGKTVFTEADGVCPHCGSDDTTSFKHVDEIEPSDYWPCVFILDPHPRKPHMFMWVQVDPKDDYVVVAEGELAGEPADVKRRVDETEESMGLYVPIRLVDPNMAMSPSGSRREITWQDEFDAVGLILDLAHDSDVGRARINEYLKPDRHTGVPRLMVRDTCGLTSFQMKRYTWDEYKHKQEKDLKQKPKQKYDDFPTMLKYLMNYLPSFNDLKKGGAVIQTRKMR